MKKAVRIITIFLITIIFISCQSIQSLNSYRRGNSFYIQNTDSEGNIVGIDNIVINNITFFQLDFAIFGLKDINSNPKELCSSSVQMREKVTLNISKKLSEKNDSLANYKYLCVQIPKGTLKKCSAYSVKNDVCIDIEQYGIEQNDIQNQIDEKLFEELEKSFNQ